jgi:molecular chaperone HtpG
MRKSGILVGDRFSLSNLFKEDRFNGWVQGEVIIVDDEIIPNARRDDFEKNDAYKFLLDHLKTIAEEISMKIRNASKERNKKKNANDKATVNKEKEIGKKELIKKVDLLIDQVNVNNEKTLKSIYEIIKSELDKKSANSLIDKIKKNVV